MNYNIELRHLKYFNILAEELHFRKAAEKLFISQPGLSRQIKLMEEEMGIILLNRDKKKVTLTRAGEYFKEEVQYILNHLQHVIRQVQSIQSGDLGELRIGFVGSAMQEVIPEILLSLNKKYPKINTSLHELSNEQQIDDIIHDKLDVGFVRKKRVPDGIYIQPMMEESFCLVLPSDHDINEKNFTDVSQLKDDNFILFDKAYSPEYFNIVMSIFEDQGFVPHITHKSVHAGTIFKLVENGMGMAIVPSSLKKGFNMDVKYIELNSIPQRTTLYLIRKHGNRNPAMKHLLELV